MKTCRAPITKPWHRQSRKLSVPYSRRVRSHGKKPTFCCRLSKVKGDKFSHAHTLHVFCIITLNPGCARALMQKHGERYIWVNPPAIPLSTEEMDSVFALPYQRIPHPSYGDARIPAADMIRFSINIMRGCFGGCSFCSITEHEGRIIQSRSEDSIVNEIEAVATRFPALPGTSLTSAALPPTCICCAASHRARSRPVVACRACIRTSAHIWIPTTNRR